QSSFPVFRCFARLFPYLSPPIGTDTILAFPQKEVNEFALKKGLALLPMALYDASNVTIVYSTLFFPGKSRA
ncbi:MAG: hypothetical protein LBC51_00170, partial [Treponema sp.]|nr:hypothetical protein [Treponema sp.]